jgi:hypothetical protein
MYYKVCMHYSAYALCQNTSLPIPPSPIPYSLSLSLPSLSLQSHPLLSLSHSLSHHLLSLTLSPIPYSLLLSLSHRLLSLILSPLPSPTLSVSHTPIAPSHSLLGYSLSDAGDSTLIP